MAAAGDRWARKLGGPPLTRTDRIKSLAKELGVGPRSLYSWEHGLRSVPWATFDRWCAIVGASGLKIPEENAIVRLLAAQSRKPEAVRPWHHPLAVARARRQ
jgi:transcriptional regulator with XRE-family HTH domain